MLVTLAPQPEKPQDTTGLIGKFIAKATAPTNDVRNAERAECERIARPLLTEAKSIQTTMGLLRSKCADKVEAYVATDWPALRAATPQVLVRDANAKMMVDVAGNAVRNFQNAVADARTALASQFGDSQPGRSEYNTISLTHAVEIMNNLLVGDNYVGDRSLDGRSVRVQSATFRQAIAQLNYWLGRSRSILQSAEHAVERFNRTEQQLTGILAKLDPAHVEPQMKRTTLPDIKPEPERGTSSYADFDPRERA
jgi:hypothetical protein